MWVPVGRLFNIWALPGTVRAVYLPHFICLSGKATMGPAPWHSPLPLRHLGSARLLSLSLQSPSHSGASRTCSHRWAQNSNLPKHLYETSLQTQPNFSCLQSSLCSLVFFYLALPSSILFSSFIKPSQFSLPHYLLCTHTTAFSSPPLPEALMTHEVLTQLRSSPKLLPQVCSFLSPKEDYHRPVIPSCAKEHCKYQGIHHP